MLLPPIIPVPLSNYTTFQLGGSCRGLITCTSPQECENAVNYFNKNKFPFILIGHGSNLLVSDKGIDCHILHYSSLKPQTSYTKNHVTVTGGTSLDALVNELSHLGQDCINFASGIPGTVGGCIVGNGGAFGKQIGDVVHSVTLLSPSGQKYTAYANDLKFSYRYSSLKKSNTIILDAILTITPNNSKNLLKERKEILTLRQEKHPNLKTHPCAGSFFRNIKPSSAAHKRQSTGWLLEQIIDKSLNVGGAKLFHKHANIIIKDKNCSSDDVYNLSLKMKKIVQDKCNITLVREVRLVGEFDKRPRSIKEMIW